MEKIKSNQSHMLNEYKSKLKFVVTDNTNI